MNWLAVSAVAAMSLVGAMQTPSFAQDIKQRVIKFGHLLSADHPQGHAIRHFGKVVSEKSGGKITVREFHSSQLGSELQQQSALQSGVQEMMSGATTTLVGMIKEFGILDFPFLLSSYEEADQLLDGPVGAKLLDKLPARGFVGLAYFENGFRNVTNNRSPIESAKNLSGLKIRVMQNPIYIDVFKGFGANPVPLAFGELYTALETRTIDAQENPYGIILNSKFYEVQKYLSVTNHSYNSNIALISKKFWDSLSPTEQKIIREAAVEASQLLRKLNRSQTEKFTAELKAKGMAINEVAPAEKAEMRNVVEPIIEKYLAEYEPDMSATFRSEVARIRASK